MQRSSLVKVLHLKSRIGASKEGVTKKHKTTKTFKGFAQCKKTRSETVAGSSPTYLRCCILAQTRALYRKELRNSLEYLVLKRTNTMKLAGGGKKADVKISGNVYTVRKCCINAKNVSRKAIESYPHLMSTADTLHLSDVAVDLLIGTDLVDAFLETHTAGGNPRDPFVKRK